MSPTQGSLLQLNLIKIACIEASKENMPGRMLLDFNLDLSILIISISYPSSFSVLKREQRDFRLQTEQSLVTRLNQDETC